MKAALSIDLDNKWSYMKTHGDPQWECYPSYLDVLVPRVLDLMDELRVRMTFFIVGRDATLPSAAQAFAQIPLRGHEVGNHSFAHEPWLAARDERAIDEEFARSEAAIQSATGVQPVGFRAPGFARSTSITSVLVARSYLYDASSLPTFIGPLARAYYFRTSRLSKAELKEREALFGHWSDALLPNAPYVRRVGDASLTEIPVTTFPIVRTPIHLSYVLYIAAISPMLARAYFRAALATCKMLRVTPSILLHPLDFFTAADVPELAFFPAMSLDPRTKAQVVRAALEDLANAFEVVPLKDVALQAAGRRTEMVVPDPG